MPAARIPAQIEAARRNGAHSRGPATDEGKARSRLNALKHGLAAAEHSLLPGEDPAAWADLLANLVEEHTPTTETEARLVHRLAAAFWRQDRADRLETKLLARADAPRIVHAASPTAAADPEESFDVRRFEPIRRYRADAAREVSRLLRQLRADGVSAAETGTRNEPDISGHPPARPGGQGPGTSRGCSPPPDGPVEPGHDTVLGDGGLRAPGGAANRNEPGIPCFPPARPGGQDLRDEPRPCRPGGPVEPGQGKKVARNEPDPPRRPNRAQRRRLAALARQAARRAA